MLNEWNQIVPEEQVSEKLSSLAEHLQQLEREVKELEPLISKMKPSQARKAFSKLTPQSLACIDALYLLVNQAPFS